MQIKPLGLSLGIALGCICPHFLNAQIPQAFSDHGDIHLYGGLKLPILRHSQKKTTFSHTRLGKVHFTRPIYMNPENRSEFTVTNSLIVKWARPISLSQVENWARNHGLRSTGTLDGQTFLLDFLNPDSDPLSQCAAFSKEPEIAWAEPEILSALQKHLTPNDPFFPWQWGLQNTGQNGFGTPGADVRADSAWNLEQGDSSVTIAILDDGIETTHPDLASNIRIGGRNYSGINSFLDPNPFDPQDKHGTAVAGIAAGIGHNGIGISGIAPKVKILPIKISTGSTWASSANLAQAIRWAADTMDADILSCSWGLGLSSNAVRDAIRDASVRGRSPGTVGVPGKGSLVFFSSGNLGTDFSLQSIDLGSPLTPGFYQVGFRYQKLGAGSHEDRVCIDNVYSNANATTLLSETFFNGIPIEWDNAGAYPWKTNDSIFYSGAGDRRSICSATPLASGGFSEIRLPLREYSANDFLDFQLRRSSETNDELQIRIYNASGALVHSTSIAGALDSYSSVLGFPASVDSSIAVGASSEFDFRAGYSQYSASGSGKQIDFVAPGNGIWKGVLTTDRSGVLGYDTSQYTGAFGGTSAACPLAAGIGALIFSRNPNLTHDQALNIMRSTSDKIGHVTYFGGYAGGLNQEYGYGRVNALKALASLNSRPIFSSQADTLIAENQLLQLTLKAIDPDGDSLRFTHLNTLEGDTLIGNLYEWRPRFSDSGIAMLRFSVSDGVQSDTDSVWVTIKNVDRPPQITAMPLITKNELDSVIFTLSTWDEDGDSIQIFVDFLPAWAKFAGRRFYGEPGFLDAGNYSVRFRAMSRGLVDTAWAQIQIIDMGTGLGGLRLVARVPGTTFQVMPAGWGEGGGVGQDSVDILSLKPGWYSFSAKAASKRTLHFSMQAFRDTLIAKHISLLPSIPLGFLAAETLLVSGSPLYFPDSAVFALGDMNQDGREDLLLISKKNGPQVFINTDSLSHMQGHLDYRLEKTIAFQNLDSTLNSAFLVDWNYDGHLDLLATSQAGDVFILYGSAAGFLTRYNLFSFPAQNPRALVEDFDDDGRPDLGVLTATQFWAYRNLGTLANPILSGSPQEIRDANGDTIPSSGASMLLDLNGDGIKDLVYASQGNLVYRRMDRLRGGTLQAASDLRLVNTLGLPTSCPTLQPCQISALLPMQGLPKMLVGRPHQPLVFHPSGLLGDLNQDKQVDAQDRDLLLWYYASQEGDTIWRAKYNLWVDGKGNDGKGLERIDIKDFAEMADSWELKE